MRAARRDIYIEQGATWTLPLTWLTLVPGANPGDPPEQGPPVDLTGWRAQMQIRKKPGGPVAAAAYSWPLPDAPQPRIALGGPLGTVLIQLEESDTDALILKEAVYDLELVDPSATPEPRVIRLLEGKVFISPNVTREVP